MKKLFSFFSNKKLIILFMSISFLITFPSVASAEGLFGGIFGFIFGGLSLPFKIAFAVVGTAIGAVAYIAGFCFQLYISIFEWIRTITMEIPITTGWAYDVGWTMTRDLVNMFFIIILVIIGIATILRLGEYQFQKTLPKLILVALLVNFSPVIVGIFVDGFNILTNFFLDNTTFSQGFGKLTEPLNDAMTGLFAGVIDFSESIIDYIPRIAGIFIIGAYYIFGSLIFVLLTVLYILRVVAFWILLILAPIAFAAYILPATRKWWTMWWTQLIQWGMIGLTTAFFLYLSSHLLSNADAVFNATGYGESLGEQPHGLTAVLVLTLPFMVSLIFLLVGLVLGLSTGAMGAQSAINFSRKQGKKLGMAAGRFASTQTLGRLMAKEHAKGESSWMRRLENRNLGLPTSQQFKEGGFWTKAKGAVGLATGGYIARGGIRTGMRAGLGYGAQQTADTEAAAKKYEEDWKADPDNAYNKYKQLGATQWKEKNAMYLAAARAKGAKGLAKFGDEEAKKRIESIATYNPKKLEDIAMYKPEILEGKINPEAAADDNLANLVVNGLVPKGRDDDDFKKLSDLNLISGDREQEVIDLVTHTKMSDTEARDSVLKRLTAAKKVVGAMKDSDVENLSTKALENKEFQEMVVRFKPPSFIRKIGEEKGQEYVDLLHNKVNDLGAKEVAKTNSVLLRQIINNPALRSTFPEPKDLSEISGGRDEKIKQIDSWATQSRSEIKTRKEAREKETAKETTKTAEEPGVKSILGRGKKKTY